jgi:hypothetical protein
LHSPSAGPVVEAVRSGPVHVTDVPSGGPIEPELGVAAGAAAAITATKATVAGSSAANRSFMKYPLMVAAERSGSIYPDTVR